MTFASRPGGAAGSPAGTPGSASTSVLVVEDEPAIATAVARRLSAEGWQVETVGDGLQAVDAAARLNPDVVVLDVMLPGIDGLGCAAASRPTGPSPSSC